MENTLAKSTFSAYRPFLHILTIYDSKNLRNPDRRVRIRNICQAIVVSVFALDFIAAVVCNTLYCLDYNFDVAQVAFSIGIISNSLQVSITCILFQMKNDLVDKVISDIGQLVNERK